MLSFFPGPYPNEFLPGIFLRYHLHSGNLSIRQTNLELFGKHKSLIASFPSNLNYLYNQLNNDSLSPDYFINFHTMLPIYKPFLSQKRTEEIIHQMEVGDTVEVPLLLGEISGNLGKNTNLKYCFYSLKLLIKLKR